MTSTLALAIERASKLPPEAQETIGRHLLKQIDSLEALRAAIEVGIKELDAGLGEELDFEQLLTELNEEYARA